MKKKVRMDIIVIAALTALAGLWFFLTQMGGQTPRPIAKVQVDGQVVREIDLDAAEDQLIPIEGGKLPVTLQVKDHKIAFVNAVCPDKLCEHNGFLNRAGQQAVCLPAKVSVHIYEK